MTPAMLAELTFDQLYLMACDKDLLQVAPPPEPMSAGEAAKLGFIPPDKIGRQSYVQMVREQIAREKRQEQREARRQKREKRRARRARRGR